jgi:hypothetical protein
LSVVGGNSFSTITFLSVFTCLVWTAFPTLSWGVWVRFRSPLHCLPKHIAFSKRLT